MSASDINELLNTPKLFIFLPGVNHTFLTATADQSYAFTICVMAIGSSAIVYNILDGIPVERASKVNLVTTAIFILSGIIWLGTLLISLLRLKNIFSQQQVIPEILFFGTVGFILLVLSHLLLLIENEYKNTI